MRSWRTKNRLMCVKTKYSLSYPKNKYRRSTRAQHGSDLWFNIGLVESQHTKWKQSLSFWSSFTIPYSLFLSWFSSILHSSRINFSFYYQDEVKEPNPHQFWIYDKLECIQWDTIGIKSLWYFWHRIHENKSFFSVILRKSLLRNLVRKSLSYIKHVQYCNLYDDWCDFQLRIYLMGQPVFVQSGRGKRSCHR